MKRTTEENFALLLCDLCKLPPHLVYGTKRHKWTWRLRRRWRMAGERYGGVLVGRREEAA